MYNPETKTSNIKTNPYKETMIFNTWRTSVSWKNPKIDSKTADIEEDLKHWTVWNYNNEVIHLWEQQEILKELKHKNTPNSIYIQFKTENTDLIAKIYQQIVGYGKAKSIKENLYIGGTKLEIELEKTLCVHGHTKFTPTVFYEENRETITQIPTEGCPKAKKHDFKIWYSHKDLKMATCQHCKKLARKTNLVWSIIKNKSWYEMRSTKEWSHYSEFDINLPAVQIFYDRNNEREVPIYHRWNDSKFFILIQDTEITISEKEIKTYSTEGENNED